MSSILRRNPALCTLLLLFSILVSTVDGNDGDVGLTTPITQHQVSMVDLLVIKGTMTILSCEPIFGTNRRDVEAVWYKNGRIIANVDGQHNAVLENRPVKYHHPVPQVGFLIISDIRESDEADYWCLRKDTKQIGEISRLRLAFIDSEPDAFITAVPTWPYFEEFVELPCPAVKGYPKPGISWLFNGKTIPSAANIEVAHNGSLLIHRYEAVNAGKYECVQTNFAGSSTAFVITPPPRYPGRFMQIRTDDGELPDGTVSGSSVIAVLQTSTLCVMFIVLAVISLVLVYFFAVLLIRRHRRFRSVHLLGSETSSATFTEDDFTRAPPKRPGFWRTLFNPDPALAPGFRKPVAPLVTPRDSTVSRQDTQTVADGFAQPLVV